MGERHPPAHAVLTPSAPLERPARRGRRGGVGRPGRRRDSRARYSSAHIGFSRERSTTRSRSDIDETSSTCSLRNHCMNCSDW